jgi:hypothetical protein
MPRTLYSPSDLAFDRVLSSMKDPRAKADYMKLLLTGTLPEDESPLPFPSLAGSPSALVVADTATKTRSSSSGSLKATLLSPHFLAAHTLTPIGTTAGGKSGKGHPNNAALFSDPRPVSFSPLYASFAGRADAALEAACRAHEEVKERMNRKREERSTLLEGTTSNSDRSGRNLWNVSPLRVQEL